MSNRVFRFHSETRQCSELANRSFERCFSLMQPVERKIEAKPTLAPIIIVHDRQDGSTGSLKGFYGNQNRIGIPKNDDVTTHEIIDTLLSNGRRGPVDNRPPLLKGQVFDGAPIQEVAQRQAVLG